jgi:glycosyltransferase involved in cell wall biosynthesis
MKVSFSATNPCHMYPVACALAGQGVDVSYYSGYPAWKLERHGAGGVRLHTHSLRTNIVYGLLKLPERFRPSARCLFLWQDRNFDRWVGRHLEACDFIHGMPGQCLYTFQAARKLGIKTVLNHATGPVREWVRIMEPEYARVGLRLEDVCAYDAAYFAREDEEYALADYHCVASTVVRDQLLATGIAENRIWTIPYGADTRVFHADPNAKRAGFRVIFAGQVCLRKGVRDFLKALEIAGKPEWQVDFFGGVPQEARFDLDGYHGSARLTLHGPVSQSRLADEFRQGSVMALPSLEEGFGLVVPQALNCGLPVIVSDRVGAKDLIRHRENGSIFPAGNAEALAEELRHWESHRSAPTGIWGWEEPAKKLKDASARLVQ